MSKRRYIAVSYGIPGNVTSSQFLEYFSLLDRGGLRFKVLLLLPGSFFVRRDSRRVLRERIGSIYRGPVYFIPAPSMDSTLGLLLQLVLLRFFCGLFSKSITVFHARNLVSANIVNKLTKFSRGIRYIYDVRGDLIGEYEYSSLKKGVDTDHIEAEKEHLRTLESDTVRNAQHIVCVSAALKELLVDRYAVDAGKFSIVPCCADEEMFRFDAEARERFRSELELQDKVVLIYSGGMDKWHCAEQIFQVVGQVQKQMGQAYFIVLTPQTDKAEALASRYLDGEQYMIKSAGRSEVANYLLASDAGIVLREVDPVNRVASPTKIAEYLISGLPVILSKGLGDYSGFIEDMTLGCVLKQDVCDITSQAEQVCNFIKQLETSDKQRISGLGIKNFSKTQYVERLKAIYQS